MMMVGGPPGAPAEEPKLDGRIRIKLTSSGRRDGCQVEDAEAAAPGCEPRSARQVAEPTETARPDGSRIQIRLTSSGRRDGCQVEDAEAAASGCRPNSARRVADPTETAGPDAPSLLRARGPDPPPSSGRAPPSTKAAGKKDGVGRGGSPSPSEGAKKNPNSAVPNTTGKSRSGGGSPALNPVTTVSFASGEDLGGSTLSLFSYPDGRENERRRSLANESVMATTERVFPSHGIGADAAAPGRAAGTRSPASDGMQAGRQHKSTSKGRQRQRCGDGSPRLPRDGKRRDKVRKVSSERVKRDSDAKKKQQGGRGGSRQHALKSQF